MAEEKRREIAVTTKHTWIKLIYGKNDILPIIPYYYIVTHVVVLVLLRSEKLGLKE
jgi:hypothetical protein